MRRFGALDDLEGHPVESELGPVRHQVLGVGLVGGDVHGPQHVGAEGPAVLQGPGGAAVEVARP